MNEVKVLVACECSQVVCSAFRRKGIKAYSCDLEPSYGGHPEWHIMCDALVVIKGCGVFPLENGKSVRIKGRWNMIIAHPPCTNLTHSSAVALSQGKHTIEDVMNGAWFFRQILNAPTDLLAIENPAPMAIAELPRYNQTIQPYDFGHKYSKRVCLWLKGLPPLLPTHARVLNHVPWLGHCSNRSKRRSKTFEGIAEAMAEQWIKYLKHT